MALLQCYGRYLQQFVSVNLDDIVDDVHQFKSTFFPNGIRDKNAAHTVGCVVFIFAVVIAVFVFFQNVHRFKISSLFYPPQMYFVVIQY